MSRQLDIYAIERRAGQIAYVLPLWIVQQSVAVYYLGHDVRRTVARWMGGAR
jgi:hypothetical protein